MTEIREAHPTPDVRELPRLTVLHAARVIGVLSGVRFRGGDAKAEREWDEISEVVSAISEGRVTVVPTDTHVSVPKWQIERLLAGGIALALADELLRHWLGGPPPSDWWGNFWKADPSGLATAPSTTENPK